MAPLWRAVAAALNRNGLGWRGRLTLPELTPEDRRRLALLERPVPAAWRTVPLADTSTRLAALVTRALVARDGPAGEPATGSGRACR